MKKKVINSLNYYEILVVETEQAYFLLFRFNAFFHCCIPFTVTTGHNKQMSVDLKTTITKIINGVYCCVSFIHEMYFWFFMYSDYSCQQRDKFIHEKMFLPNFYNSHFAFFEKLFYWATSTTWTKTLDPDPEKPGPWKTWNKYGIKQYVSL